VNDDACGGVGARGEGDAGVLQEKVIGIRVQIKRTYEVSSSGVIRLNSDQRNRTHPSVSDSEIVDYAQPIPIVPCSAYAWCCSHT